MQRDKKKNNIAMTHDNNYSQRIIPTITLKARIIYFSRVLANLVDKS